MLCNLKVVSGGSKQDFGIIWSLGRGCRQSSLELSKLPASWDSDSKPPTVFPRFSTSCTLSLFLSPVWSVTEQTLPPETAASSSDQAKNRPGTTSNTKEEYTSWRHNTWSETRSLCLLNSFERALPNAASSLCFLQCCTVRLPGAAAVVFFISLIDHFLSLSFFFFFFPKKKI